MRKHSPTKPATVPLLYAIEPHLLDIGRRKAYEAAKTGELVEGIPVIKVGNSSRVPTSALERVLGVELDVADLERWAAERQAERETARAAS